MRLRPNPVLYLLLPLCVSVSSDQKFTVVLTSNKVTTRKDFNTHNHNARTRRSVFNTKDQNAILDKHNEYRRIPIASNMEKLRWNSVLARMAEGWAQKCSWSHGQPRTPNPPYEHIGQSLYANNGTFDVIHGVELWYSEVKWYDYNRGCAVGQKCGHYTQLMWAKTKELGCAYAFCPRMAGTDIINAHHVVCNYGPAGNWRDEKPYNLGPGCRRCTSGRGWCEQGLCVESCTSQDCECKAQCNDGKLNPANCSCSCKDGWTGADCSSPCMDHDEYCGADVGWPAFWCDSAHQYVINKCPLLCGTCKAPSGSIATSTAKPVKGPVNDQPSAATSPISSLLCALISLYLVITLK